MEERMENYTRRDEAFAHVTDVFMPHQGQLPTFDFSTTFPHIRLPIHFGMTRWELGIQSQPIRFMLFKQQTKL
jgi:hypothetical protein